MSKINFQFHALKEETAEILMKFIKENSLTAITVNTSPHFKYKVYSAASITPEIIASAWETLLMLDAPVESSSNYIDFLRDNIGFLSIMIGEQGSLTLGESKISGEASGQTLKLWKRLVAQYKRTMTKGAWVTNGSNEGYSKNHWYTYAAKNLYELGWTIRPIAGGCIYRLESM